jgi:hypothetical protein
MIAFLIVMSVPTHHDPLVFAKGYGVLGHRKRTSGRAGGHAEITVPRDVENEGRGLAMP